MATQETRVVYITEKTDFIEFLKNNPYVIVKATATWCGPCKMIKPFVDKWIEILPQAIKVVVFKAFPFVIAKYILAGYTANNNRISPHPAIFLVLRNNNNIPNSISKKPLK